MFDCAYKWKDMEMWRNLIKSFEKNVKANGVIRAFRVFTFDQTRSMYVICCVYCLLLISSSSIEELLCNKRLPDRLAIIDGIRRAASESDETNVIQEWCSQQLGHTLASYVSADVSDISLLVSMACENGIQTICQV